MSRPERSAGESAVSGAVNHEPQITEQTGQVHVPASVPEQPAPADARRLVGQDLHDVVIRRLYSVGLMLQGAVTQTDEPAVRKRIEQAIDEIDGTIRDIRTAILALYQQPPAAHDSRSGVRSAPPSGQRSATPRRPHDA